jgi:hypothetical protein
MFKSFFTVSFFISISRILGFIRDILIARYIGVSVISDAFFAAFRKHINNSDDFEIEYRLAGFHMLLNEEEKGNYHLSNGLRINMKHQTLLKEMFPTVWDRISVQDYIAKHKK